RMTSQILSELSLFFFQAEDGIRDGHVTGVQTCALPIYFTFGENLGAGDCRVPVECFDYRPTRQPIVLDWWAPATRTAANGGGGRSEERRVGKECRSRWWRCR